MQSPVASHKAGISLFAASKYDGLDVACWMVMYERSGYVTCCVSFYELRAQRFIRVIDL